MTIDKTLGPGDWHKKPRDLKGPCSVCGCIHNNPGVHRRGEDENLGTFYQARRRSRGGWQYKTLGIEGYCRFSSKRNPSLPVLSRMVKASTIAAKGGTLSQIAEEVGVSLNAMQKTILYHQEHWDYFCNEAEKQVPDSKPAGLPPDLFTLPQDDNPRDCDHDQQPFDNSCIVGTWELDPGPTTAVVSTPLCEFVLQTYAPARIGIHTDTVAQYVYACRSLERFCGRPVLVSELTDSLVLPWLSHRLQVVAPKTVKRERGDLLAVWRWAAKHGYCPQGPGDIPTIKVPRRSPVAWLPDEFDRLITTCRGLRGEMQGTAISRAAWWSSLMVFLYWTGARIGAALAVAPGDVNLQRWYVVLRADTSKTDFEQVVALHTQAVDAIESIWCPHRTRLWPYPYNDRQIWPQLKTILIRAGLPHDRNRMFHCVRRTTYTLATKYGSRELASEQLGHRTDMSRHYLDQSQIDRLGAVNVLPLLCTDHHDNQPIGGNGQDLGGNGQDAGDADGNDGNGNGQDVEGFDLVYHSQNPR